MFIETFRRNFNCNTINKPALTMPPDAFCHSRFTVVSNLCVFYLSVFFQQLFLRNKNRILISSEKYIPLSQAIILASSCFWNEMNKKISLHMKFSRVFGFTSCHDHYCILLHTQIVFIDHPDAVVTVFFSLVFHFDKFQSNLTSLRFKTHEWCHLELQCALEFRCDLELQYALDHQYTSEHQNAQTFNASDIQCASEFQCAQSLWICVYLRLTRV